MDSPYAQRMADLLEASVGLDSSGIPATQTRRDSTSSHDSVRVARPPAPPPRPQVVITESPNRTAESAFARLTDNMSDLFQQLADRLGVLPRPGVTHREATVPPYHGDEHEDPRRFIQQLERLFVEAQIPEEDRVNTAHERLKGQARRWSQNILGLSLTYEVYRERFLEKFDGFASRSNAKAMLYGQRQTDQEDVEVFISRKRNLFYRLEPNADETMMVRTIIEQLKPEIRLGLRFLELLPTVGIEDLVRVANRIEADCKGRPSLNSQTTTAPRTNASTNAYPEPTAPEVAPRGPATNNRSPPTPCRYCQAWHFHKECPQNPFNRPGNARRAVPPRDNTNQAVTARIPSTSRGAPERAQHRPSINRVEVERTDVDL